MLGVGGAGLALSPVLSPTVACAQSQGAGDGKNLVVVNLLGGMDGYGALPYYDGTLATSFQNQLRPTLSLNPNQVIQLTGQNGLPQKIGLHPAWKSLHDVASSRMKVLKNYGIVQDPGRSHDTCQILMSLGVSTLQAGANVGLLARLMDHQNWDSMQFWSFADTNSSDLNATKKRPISVYNLDSFNHNHIWWESEEMAERANAFQQQLLTLRSQKSSLGQSFLTESENMHTTIQEVVSNISPINVGSNATGDYDESRIGQSLRDAMKVLKWKESGKNMLTLVSQQGYDTHSGQANSNGDSSLSSLITTLSDNLAVFYTDLALSGLLDSTVILIISEFGRTLRENESSLSVAGTDHGHGSNTIALGASITSGIIGDDLTSNDLTDPWYNAGRPTLDYRDIFSDVFAWMGVTPEEIFTETSYTRQPLGLFS